MSRRCHVAGAGDCRSKSAHLPGSSSRRLRRPRSRQVDFDEDMLYDLLLPLARDRKIPWDWLGQDYQKPLRSLSADREVLERSAPALKVLAEVACNGYPKQDPLQRVLHRLHRELSI